MRQRDALASERDEFLRQRDGLIAERDELLQRGDTLAEEGRRWFEAAVAPGTAISSDAALDGARARRLKPPLLGLSRICKWQPQNRLIATARRASAERKWELAARFYREAIGYTPYSAALWVQYGHALKESGKLEAGECAYRRSLECDNRIADTHLQLGHVLVLQDRGNEASESYLCALRLAPYTHDAFYGLLALGWTAARLRSELKAETARPRGLRSRTQQQFR
jgi:tetratricopeptide (TPR) repeat protein